MASFLKFLGGILLFYGIAFVIYLAIGLFDKTFTITDALICCLVADVVRLRLELKERKLVEKTF